VGLGKRGTFVKCLKVKEIRVSMHSSVQIVGRFNILGDSCEIIEDDKDSR